MKKFAFISANGEAKHTCTPSDETVFVAGQLYGDLVCQEVPMDVPDEVLIARWYWKDGQAKIRPVSPGVDFSWNAQSEAWEFDLVRARQDKWSQIKSARDEAEYGGFEWQGHVFDSDPLSQNKIQGAGQLALLAASSGQPYSVEWTLKDNSALLLTGESVIAVGIQMGQHIAACHAKARTLRQAIERATSKEEIAAIVW